MSELTTYILLTLIAIVFTILYLKIYFKIHTLDKLVKKIIIFNKSEKQELRKIRKRYIVFSVIGDRSFSKQLVEKTIRDTYRKLFGELLLIQADPQLIYFDQSLQRGIVRTTHLHKDSVVITLSFIREIDGYKCLVIPMKTTGTIKKARKILYRLHREVGKT